ncbi:MAG: cytochrome P450 [Nitrospira sp.]|nr:cytochrome P450 [Nitrospira sp.]
MIDAQIQRGLQDVQGNILTGYHVAYATYLFYRIDLTVLARQWLAALLPDVTTEKMPTGTPSPAMLNVAVSYQGLKALGVSPTSLNSFPVEFQQGMKKRAALLCDFGESAPDKWDSPLGRAQVHVLVVVHGINREQCDIMVKRVKDHAPQGNGMNRGVTLLGETAADGLPGEREHFGFKDGISQPWIQGTNPGPPIQPDGGKRTSKGLEPLNLGEFLLGYKDELDRIPSLPTPLPLAVNGTYLVIRKLRQNVAEFWKQMEEQATQVLGSGGTKERLAALMLGRWPSGCPVLLSQDKDDPEIAKDLGKVNAFNYDMDQDGRTCPVGAHIRRTHPRDLKRDETGTVVVEPTSTRHRMIRRGLPYGPALEGKEDDKQDRGLMFIALVADIGRQFEFLQRNWINSGDSARLDRTERDPLVGNNRDERDMSAAGQPHEETPRKFSVPTAPRLPWALKLPEFVTTRGGDYFFLPSLTALHGLANLAFSSFRQEYNHLEETIPDPRKKAQAQGKLISDWLIYRPKEMFDELREKAPVFQMPGYPDPFIPPITIVTKYKDVLEVLDHTQHPEFTVKLYRDKMEIAPPRPPRGPFILGMEARDPRYMQELPILGKAVQASAVSRMVPHILAHILDPIFSRVGPTGKLDVIQDLAWPVPLGLNDRFFGVPGPDDPGPDNKTTFKRWLRDLYTELFLNLRGDTEWTKAADIAAAEMNAYLDGLIQQIVMRPNDVPDSVVRELIRASLEHPELAPTFVRRNMMGLTVGVVETSLKAIGRTIDQLIRRPHELTIAQAAAKAGDKGTVLTYALEAMRFNPQNHVLFRVCAQDTRIAKGTGRDTEIKKGTVVFASTLSAMFDEDGPFTQPSHFKPDRDPQTYLFFGYDAHECLGRHLAPSVLQEVLMRVLTLKNLRRANDDPFDPIDLRPEHFLLEFDP